MTDCNTTEQITRQKNAPKTAPLLCILISVTHPHELFMPSLI